MRPHLLTLTAFGSFPGTETVEFDALAEAGLFLVHGPTGAGKTTILDALCFALFGKVANAQRDSARSLRCDHAPPGAGPSVTLEVTIRGRLLRIERSPAWQRPKLRGTGVTEEKAKVILQERLGSDWAGLTTRADEAGDLIGGLLGMNADQFCQVAMLPQGDFARFLRADGDDRRKLLERLFTVKVFTQAESWLAEHRKQTWRSQQELRQQVDFAVQRIEEAAGDDLREAALDQTAAAPALSAAPGAEPALFELPEAAPPAVVVQLPTADADPLGWAGALLAAARAVVATSAGEHATAEQTVRAARAGYDTAAALADRQRRHAEARTLRRTLDERADERADLQAILDDAARADRVLPLITAGRQRAEAAAKARTLAADAVARARPLITGRPGTGTPEPALLSGLERDRQAEIARLSELLTEEARLSVIRRDLHRVEAELTALATEDESVAARLGTLPARIDEAERLLAESRVDAARVPAAEAARAAVSDLLEADRELVRLAARLDDLTRRRHEAAAAEAALPDRLSAAKSALAEVQAEAATIPAAHAARDAARAGLDAARRREALTAELVSATASLRHLVDRAQTLRERWLDLRQARLDGMAAELARDLTDGRPCAVCGSAHHPHPAAPAPSAPSAEDEHAAEAAHETALAAREAAERTIVTLESRLATAIEAAGGTTRADGADGADATAGGDAPGDRGLAVDAAEIAVRVAEREVARLHAVAEREPALLAAVERLEAELQRATRHSREIGEALAAHRTHHTQLQAERTRLLARLTQYSGDDVSPAAAAGVHGGEAEPSADAMAEGGMETAAAGAAEPTAAVAEGAAEMSAEAGIEMLAAAENEVARLRRSAGREPALAAEATRLQQERVTLDEQGRRVTARLAACRTRQEELSGDAGRLAARLDSARGADPTLTARLSRLSDEAELLREALEATQRAVTAVAEHEAAVVAADAAAVDAGFADAADATAAARPLAEREGKAELLRELDAQHAAVTRTLADPELAAAAAEPVPDLPALAAARDAAEAAHTALASARDRARARQHRLAELHTELAACLDRWQPAADAHQLAERLASLASGTSGDNQWSMSLSSFVLGERLRQVVDAANERLDHMSAGRYQLRHDLRKTAGARGRSGGGLGLRIADSWTGVDRDPATLSGGESFITSLALALGLADVVTAEAGGAEIGTLFVDEGFGTLDEDTLDDVLDILDGLRDGGRAVGIVSHVAELRTRIPAQLKVTKTRTGSTLTTVAG